MDKMGIDYIFSMKQKLQQQQQQQQQNAPESPGGAGRFRTWRLMNSGFQPADNITYPGPLNVWYIYTFLPTWMVNLYSKIWKIYQSRGWDRDFLRIDISIQPLTACRPLCSAFYLEMFVLQYASKIDRTTSCFQASVGWSCDQTGSKLYDSN